MKKINKYLLKNIEKIFIIFLFLQPLIDVFTAISIKYFHNQFTIGIIFRVIFLIFMLYYIIFLNKNTYKKRSLIYIGIIFIYFILYSLNIIFTKDIRRIHRDRQAFLFQERTTQAKSIVSIR